ncbi:Protein of unknown function DUF1666 [Dillenia turbinata]|uniref:Uncharacterized protein n=1 Tax=Dillenia turbinata TaxID=194707 RepID=A0AAN8U990_9MAGN
MDFFKVKKFRKAHKPDPEKGSDDKPGPLSDETKNENGDGLMTKSAADNGAADPVSEVEDDDDDFITNEIKRRLKELRRNSFMVLIPEEPCTEEEEEEEEERKSSSSEWRESEIEHRHAYCCFDAIYDKYCERMLFFDRMSAQQLKEAGSQVPLNPSPRSASKKLASPLRCLSLKRIEEPEEEKEHLQPPEIEPSQDLETVYVAHLCLTWETLHCQYTQMSQKISCQPENPTCYSHSAQQFQHFQVLLQRFIENEPFEQGLRVEKYARARNTLPKLLQVPNLEGLDRTELGREEESEMVVLAPDLMREIENSILTFQLFLKMDKKKASSARNPFGVQNQSATLLQLVQSSLQKKEVKLKEVRKKKKGWKKNSWPAAEEEVELLFGLIDCKIISRVLRMVKITKEQLLWCEEKMKKLELTNDGRLQRDLSPVLFPC